MRRFSAFAVMLYCAAPLWAQQPDTDDLLDERLLEVPSEELLEFLASWETADGQWLPPSEVAELPMPEQDKTEVLADEDN